MNSIQAAPAEVPPTTEKTMNTNEKSDLEISAAPAEAEEGVLGEDGDAEKRDQEMPGQDLQQGVQDVEAITLSWSKWHLAAVLFK